MRLGPALERPAKGHTAPPSGPLTLLLVAGLLLSPARPARAQAAAGDTLPPEPTMAEAPNQFRLSLSGAGLFWKDDPARSVSDGTLWGIDLERTVARYASLRLGGAVGSADLTVADRSSAVTSYLVELLAEGRLALPSLVRVGVVPLATVGVAGLTFDPEEDGVSTVSQNTFLFGGGVEVLPLPHLGARLEWRRYSVQLENPFEPVDRSGETRDADRLLVTLFWAL